MFDNENLKLIKTLGMNMTNFHLIYFGMVFDININGVDSFNISE